MKLTFVLRNKKNALKISTKTIESFIERIKTDTKDGSVTRRRKQLSYGDYIEGYDRQYPSHLIYPSAEFEKDANDNLRMKIFNGIVALTVEGLDTAAEIEAVKQTAQILHYTLAAFIGPSGKEVIILVRIAGSANPSEEEASAICQEGHRLASALYQAILPKNIQRETVSVRSCFHMPLDEHPYYNSKALALPVSAKPLPFLNHPSQDTQTEDYEATDEISETYSDMDAEIIDRTYWPQNYPILRLEDIMLLYAECVGRTEEGYEMVNKIRRRAGLSEIEEGLSEEEFQTAVANERRYELAEEGHRWFDLVRQEKYVDMLRAMFINDDTTSGTYAVFANRVTKDMYLYPIPQSQIEVREGLYTQNPDY